MARQDVDIGVEGNDGTGDSIRESFRKVNENFTELYAVFGIGGQINFTSLGDTPDTLEDQNNKIAGVSNDGTAINLFTLASQGAVTGNANDDTIEFDFDSVPGTLVVRSVNTKVEFDNSPSLGGPLNASTQPIANTARLETRQDRIDAVNTFKNTHGLDISEDDLIIDKGYGDTAYLQRDVAGMGARIPYEPSDTSAYTITVTSYAAGNVFAPNHGLTQAATGSPWIYETTGNDADNLSNLTTYYIRVLNENEFSIHPTKVDALDVELGTKINANAGSGVQTFVDAAFDTDLAGNWLDNVALPRKSVVRRQGDTMEGLLNLSDHPGELAGFGTPNGVDDLQAASKFYVDSVSYSGTENLYVSTTGDDRQLYSPAGKEGRAWAYAFRTVNKALQVAEEMQISSEYETGPYRQTITYGGSTPTTIISAGITNPVPGSDDVRTLIEENIEYVAAEVVAFVNQTYPDLDYNSEICARDITYILQSVAIDIQNGARANYLSRYAGLRYYANPSAAKAIGAQRDATIAGIRLAQTHIEQIIQNTAPLTTYQTEETQYTNPSLVADPADVLSVNEKFDIVVDVIEDGARNAPNPVYESTYTINFGNNNQGYVDQGNIVNTDIIPGKVIVGKTSGAKARITNYYRNILAATDRVECQLLEATEFIDGEELEYGNFVRNKQITVHIESGIYEEDYPMKVSANVSIKGDEFRRVIIRPRDRVSQSPWADTFFYRDAEFDGLTITTAGIPRYDEVSGELAGYYGRHYLQDSTDIQRIGPLYNNTGQYTIGSEILQLNKEFITEEVIQYISTNYPALVYDQAKCRRDTGLIVDAISNDFITGGLEQTLEAQGEYYSGAVGSGQEIATADAIEYIAELAYDLFLNRAPTTIRGALTPDLSGGVAEAGTYNTIYSLVRIVSYAFDPDYNPPLRNDQMDVFLMNDATILRNITVQGHGGFMCVLDPTGQILTKSPYIQTGSSFSKSINAQTFAGGMFIDAFCGNIPAEVYDKDDPFTLYLRMPSQFTNANPVGLFIRRPETPAPFYILGRRFQVNSVDQYDPEAGTCRILLDASSNDGAGFDGSFLPTDVSPIEITIQTAGYRSMLGNDFTQVNDLGYGLVCVNGAISEMVSMFTYYCWTSYYSKNGSEIRSLTGSSCYGEYGLVAEGADPNEIPDIANLVNDLVQTAKSFSVEKILTTTDLVTVNEGRLIKQATSGAKGRIVFTSTSKEIYLIGISGSFNLLDELSEVQELDTVTNISGADAGRTPANYTSVPQLSTTGSGTGATFDIVIDGSGAATSVIVVNPGEDYAPGDTITISSAIFGGGANLTFDVDTVLGAGSLGPDSVPTQQSNTDYSNQQGNLFVYLYDTEFVPNNRGELDLYHAGEDFVTRYELSNLEDTGVILDSYEADVTVYTTTADPAGPLTFPGPRIDAVFLIKKDRTNGYTVDILNSGSNYEVGDTFTIDGTLLSGVSGGVGVGNDCIITVDAVDSTLTTDDYITEISVTGDIVVQDTTPVRNGRVFKLNFSTGSEEYSSDGLSEDVITGTPINVRSNQSFLISGIDRPGTLTIRPSTALIFDENREYIYRTISFGTQDNVGDELENGTLLAGLDSGYDYIRMIVDKTNAAANTHAGSGTTMGATAGDTTIAILLIPSEVERNRINNNAATDVANRPANYDPATAVNPLVITWSGKKHIVYNYREVDGTGAIAAPSEGNAYAIVDIQDVPNNDINIPATASGIAEPVILGTSDITLRAGLANGSTGDLTVAISTCRATGHDFLDVGTGGFNQSNYPSVLFGEPLEKRESQEVEERNKGRVFFVSTDQNGFFRVGRFFTVDQGTGTVTFSASIALSNVDGIGFKRGVPVTEFSTDSAMTDNATDTVPTESAVRGYVNRRLGFDQNGQSVTNPLGPGVLAANGVVSMQGNLNANGYTIVNIKDPLIDDSGDVAVNKSYVDSKIQATDSLSALTDLSIRDIQPNQLIVSTNYKKLVLNTIAGGTFTIGDIITGAPTLAEGEVFDVEEITSPIIGNVVVLTYQPTNAFDFELSDTVTVGAVSGVVVDGPLDYWTNAVNDPDADIELTTELVVTDTGGGVLDREVLLDLQIKPDTIINADVKSNAAIAQSKLNLNAAQASRNDSFGISQNDLGVAHFDSAVFTSENGWITIANGQMPLRKIERINDGTVLGNSSGDSSDNDIDAIPFDTVIDEGGGLLDSDFEDTSIVPVGDVNQGKVLVKLSDGVYGVSTIAQTGTPNSIVKTQADGSIRVNSLKLGGDNSYQILSLDTTRLDFKTPGQGLILSAQGGTPGDAGAGIAPTYPIVNIPGSVSIGGVDVGVANESSLQDASNFNGESNLGVDWIYTSFLEAPGERGTASTGIAIGANTGKTVDGQIGIIVSDSGTNSSVAPFTFSSVGALPDIDQQYDIGSDAFRYWHVYAHIFDGTATQARFADLAENYLGDAQYEPGTVLVFGGDAEVTVCSKKDDTKVAGVVTTNPAHLMNSHLKGENVVGVALQGRVPCKVIGEVKKGDMLVTSAVPGYAIVNNNPTVGTVIGKAVADKTDGGRGVIEVVVGRV